MISAELLVLNFEEVRRRSILLFSGIPEDIINWRPDAEAMSIIELIRHVLQSPYIYSLIIKNRGWEGSDFITPWDARAFTTIADEIAFAQPYHQEFIAEISSYSDHELSEIEIIRADRNQRRRRGDYLLRIAYHEAVHTGNILTYLRTLNIPRPEIWD